MTQQFDKGDKVMTPHGPGVVAYRRMKGPDYREVAAYSVILDGRTTGAIYPASDVTGQA